MPKFNLTSTSSLLEMIDAATGPDDIVDGFAYVAGYLESVISARIEKEENPKVKAAYQHSLAAVTKGWEAFHAAMPDDSEASQRATELHLRQYRPKEEPAPASKPPAKTGGTKKQKAIIERAKAAKR